jgi:hypothetical protein
VIIANDARAPASAKMVIAGQAAALPFGLVPPAAPGALTAAE